MTDTPAERPNQARDDAELDAAERAEGAHTVNLNTERQRLAQWCREQAHAWRTWDGGGEGPHDVRTTVPRDRAECFDAIASLLEAGGQRPEPSEVGFLGLAWVALRDALLMGDAMGRSYAERPWEEYSAALDHEARQRSDALIEKLRASSGEREGGTPQV